ncbi:MAG: hypothetical protein JWO70_4837 [Betaproteobacteria bacterium]|nr:hypothetical protein [Betaproteobacteria bacterium]
MSHSRMVQTRRKKQVGKKIQAREAKQVKKLGNQSGKPAGTETSASARPE